MGCMSEAPVSHPEAYSTYWQQLLTREYREGADQLRQKRARWPPRRLEASGLAIFDATAAPDTDLFGEKIVRISRPGETRLADRFSRGDILVLSPDDRVPSWSSAAERFVPRECCVVETGKDWITVSVGQSWPSGLWEARRRPGSFRVRLDRAAPRGPLTAQRDALELTRKGAAGEIAALLASDATSMLEAASSLPPPRLAGGTFVEASDQLTGDPDGGTL